MRGLHPCEALTAGRLKRALDELRGEVGAKEEGKEEEEGVEGKKEGEGEGEAQGQEEGKKEGGGEEVEEGEADESEEERDGEEDDKDAAPAAVGNNLPQSAVDHDLRGFRVLPRSGFKEALEEALAQARAGGTKAALLLLVQGAPPLPEVLRRLAAA